jgi:hypothetical protein
MRTDSDEFHTCCEFKCMINCSRYGLIQRAADDSIPALIPAIALLATRHTEHQGQGPGRHPLKVGALLRWWRSRALYAAGGGHFRLHIGLYRLICAVLYGLVYVVLWGPTGSASLLSKGAATMTRTRLGRLRRHRTSHAHAHDVTEVRQVHLHAVRHTLALIMHRAGIAPADAAALLGHTVQTHLAAYLPLTEKGARTAASGLGAAIAGVR